MHGKKKSLKCNAKKFSTFCNYQLFQKKAIFCLLYNFLLKHVLPHKVQEFNRLSDHTPITIPNILHQNKKLRITLSIVFVVLLKTDSMPCKNLKQFQQNEDRHTDMHR